MLCACVLPACRGLQQQQQYGGFDGLEDDFAGPGGMQQQGGFAADGFGPLADEGGFEGGGGDGGMGYGGVQDPAAGAVGTWDDAFDWEAAGPQGAQQAAGMGMGMGMGMNGGGGDWGDMGDGSNWAGGEEDLMLGQMGPAGGMAGQGGMVADGGGGFVGMRGAAGAAMGMGMGMMRAGGMGVPPGNAAGANPNACFNCGASDHMARNCPHPKDFATQCHNCGEMGHRAKDCPNAPSQPPPPPMGQRPGWGGAGGWTALVCVCLCVYIWSVRAQA